MSWKRWVLTVLSFAAAIGVSIHLVISGWQEGSAPVALPLLAHMLAAGAVLVEVAARGLKLVFAARSLDIPLGLRGAMKTCLGGDFAASITPARSGSEPARFLLLSESGVRPAQAILLLFVEMAMEMLSIAIVAAGLALAFHNGGAATSGMVGVVGGYAAFVLGVGVVGYVLANRNASGPPPGWAGLVRLHAGRWRTIQRALRQLRDSVKSLRVADWRLATLALAVSLVHVLARLAVLPALVLLVDPSVPLAPLLTWPLALLYGGGVAPAPAGGGVVEFAFQATLGHHLPNALFGTVLVWWRFYSFYIYLLLGALVAWRVVAEAIREDEPDESEEIAAAA